MNNPENTSFEEKVSLATRMPGPSSEFEENLWKQVVKQPRPQSTRKTLFLQAFPHPALVASAIVLAIVLVVAAVGPQRVLAAFRSLFSYIPGVGFVQDTEAVRRLVEPVRLEWESYAVTVEDLVTSEQQTWIKVLIEGWEVVSDDLITRSHEWEGAPTLLIDDGQRLSPIISQSYGHSPLTVEYIFPPLPDEIQTVTLALPQLPLMPKGIAPENWQFVLRLRPSGSDEGLPTVIEQDWQSPPSDGLTLFLDHVAQGTDQTVLNVRIEPENPRIRPAEDWATLLSLKDASNRIYPLTDESSLGNQDELAHALRTWSFKGGERLTLQLDQLLLAESQPHDSSTSDFRFDPGDQSQIGQTWRLDQTLSTERFTIHVTGADLNRGPSGQVRLTFTVEGQAELEGVLFSCSPNLCIGAEGGGVNGDPIKPALVLKDLPTEPIDIWLNSIYYRVTGPWEIHWQIPALPKEISIKPTIVPIPTTIWALSPTTTSENPILKEVMALIDQSLGTFQTGNGWVHVIAENQTGECLGQDPSGGLIPNYSVMESWYELDPDGFITRMITLMKTPDGQVVQQAITVGRYSYNITLNTFLEFDDKPRKINIADEAITFLQQMVTNDLPIYLQETSCDGRTCLLVTPFEPGEQPDQQTYYRIYETAGFPKLIWIDLETGQPVLQERVQIDSDGVLQRWDSIRLVTLEQTTPPQDLLQLFSQVVLPSPND